MKEGPNPRKKRPDNTFRFSVSPSLATVFRRPPPFFVRSAEGAERGRGRAEVAEKGAGGVSGRSLRAEFPGGVSGRGRMGPYGDVWSRERREMLSGVAYRRMLSRKSRIGR